MKEIKEIAYGILSQEYQVEMKIPKFCNQNKILSWQIFFLIFSFEL